MGEVFENLGPFDEETEGEEMEDEEMEEEEKEEEEDWIWLSAFISNLWYREKAKEEAVNSVLVVKFEGVDDDKTCPLCSFLHGKYFFYENIKELELIPPLHKGCRDHLKVLKLGDLSDEDKIYKIIELPPSLLKHHTLKKD